jgi:hypothetical protein
VWFGVLGYFNTLMAFLWRSQTVNAWEHQAETENKKLGLQYSRGG